MSDNSWEDFGASGYESNYGGGESFSQVPIDRELSQIFRRLLREALRIPIMPIEPELTEFYPRLPIFLIELVVASTGGYSAGEFTRPAVNLSQAEIEAYFRDRGIEFCLVEGPDGVIVAKFKGESPDTPSSDE